MPKKIRAFLETFLYGNYTTFIYITYWSILHFLSGIFTGVLFQRFSVKNVYWNGFLLHSAWELWQIMIGMSKPWNLIGHNGFVDICMDTILFMLGLALFQSISEALSKKKF